MAIAFLYKESMQWLNQVQAMRRLKHVRALMNVHGPVVSDARDFSRMDASDASGNRAWEVFWFALTSFLQGYDDTRQNGLMNFTLWGYTQFYWFNEFDPRYLHLGKARGEFHRIEGREGHVYVREFDAGWAVVNPAEKPAHAVHVPEGEARVVDHDSLEHPETRPLMTEFDLAAHRGIVLLKRGKAIGQSSVGGGAGRTP